jgi:hypothetical protein
VPAVDPGGAGSTREQEDVMRNNKALWVVQGLLALLFVFAGGMKLVLPIEAMKGPVALPGLFLRFIGVVEVLGGLGLILPGLLRTAEALTPLAAAGLVVVMAGATVVTLIGGDIAPAIVPVIVGMLATAVAVGRGRPAARLNQIVRASV